MGVSGRPGAIQMKAVVSHPLSWHRAVIAVVLSVQSFIWCRNIIAAAERIGGGHCAGVLGGTMRNRYSALLNQSKSPAVTEPDSSNEFDDAKKLSDADQAKVDAFLKRGVNSVERKPFKPLFLVFLLMAVVAAFSLLSQGIAQWAGIY